MKTLKATNILALSIFLTYSCGSHNERQSSPKEVLSPTYYSLYSIKQDDLPNWEKRVGNINALLGERILRNDGGVNEVAIDSIIKNVFANIISGGDTKMVEKLTCSSDNTSYSCEFNFPSHAPTNLNEAESKDLYSALLASDVVKNEASMPKQIELRDLSCFQGVVLNEQSKGCSYMSKNEIYYSKALETLVLCESKPMPNSADSVFLIGRYLTQTQGKLFSFNGQFNVRITNKSQTQDLYLNASGDGWINDEQKWADNMKNHSYAMFEQFSYFNHPLNKSKGLEGSIPMLPTQDDNYRINIDFKDSGSYINYISNPNVSKSNSKIELQCRDLVKS